MHAAIHVNCPSPLPAPTSYLYDSTPARLVALVIMDHLISPPVLSGPHMLSWQI